VQHWQKSGHKEACAALPPVLRGITYAALPYGADVAADSELCTKAEVCEDSKAYHPAEALRNLGTYLSEMGSTISLDDVLFGQLLVYAAHPDKHDSMLLELDANKVVLWSATSSHDDDDAAARLRIFEPALQEHKDAAGELARHFKMRERPRRVLYGPDANGRYVGLSEDGPMRLTPEEWAEQFVSAALLCLDEALVASDQEWIGKANSVTDLAAEDWHML
jgi:hypothetical protein